MAEGLAELRATLDKATGALEAAQKQAGKEIGYLGREEVNRAAERLFGGDRRFSGAKGPPRSKTAGKQATVTFRVFSDRVEVYPSGDPWYIFLKGRGRSNIVPRHKKRRALSTPYGAFRRVHGGAMASRPGELDPPTDRIGDKAPDLIWKALRSELVRAGFS